MILARPWYDAALLGFIAVFFLIELVLLFRKSRLGWAMTSKCLWLAGLFAFALVAPLLPRSVQFTVVWVLRLGVVMSLAWVIYELIALRRAGKTVVVGRNGTAGHGTL